MARNRREKGKFDIKNLFKFDFKIDWTNFLRRFGMVFLVFVFISIVYQSICYYARSSAYFDVRYVGCLPSRCNNLLELKPVMASLKGKNIFDVDIKNIAGVLRNRYPQASSINVKRKLPDTVIFQMYWRKPYAQIKSDKYYVIDEYGIGLSQASDTAFKDLPIIFGATIKKQSKTTYNIANVKNVLKLIHAINGFKNISVDPDYLIDVSDSKQYKFFLDNGIEIVMGSDNFHKKLVLLSAMLRKLNREQQKEIAYIDLRFKDVIVCPVKKTDTDGIYAKFQSKNIYSYA